MSPVLYNVVISAVSVVYVFAVVAIMDFFVKKGFPQDISRKVVHISAGCLIIFWVFFDKNNWSMYLNIAPAAIWMVLLLLKGFTASEDDNAVKTMTRSGNRKELLRGPLYFTIVLVIMGTIFFNSPLAAVTMGILSFGDGLAPLFGSKFGKHKYNIVTQKSWEGSISFLVFGFLGALLFSLIIFGEYNLNLIIICSVITMLVEAVSPKDLDNLLIPLTCLIIFNII